VRESITALESALAELEDAKGDLPDDLRMELDEIIEQARGVLAALRNKTIEGSAQADATG
jgi:hypothetical protein